jgi:hypothetical protein
MSVKNNNKTEQLLKETKNISKEKTFEVLPPPPPEEVPQFLSVNPYFYDDPFYNW